MPSAQRKAGSSGAGALVTTAIGVYLGSTSHPHWAMVLYVSATLEAIYSALQWEWVQRFLGFPALSVMPSPSPSTVNTSAANGNTIEQYFYGVPPSTPQVSALSATPLPAYPTFHWRFRFARVAGLNNVFSETSSRSGLQSLALELSAVPPEPGTTVRKCTLYGAITLLGDTPTEARFLNRLCWLGERGNEVDFEIGKTATLFVLCFQSNVDTGHLPKWSTFQNPVARPQDNLSLTAGTELDGQRGRQIMIPGTNSPTFTVSLIDPYSSHVVDKRTVRLHVSAEEDWRVEDMKTDSVDGHY